MPSTKRLNSAVAWPALAPAVPPDGVPAPVARLIEIAPGADRLADPDLDASDDTWARAWLDSILAALPPNAVVISWWSWSTALWYGLYAEHRRPDLLVIDDRDVLDDGYESGTAALEHWLGVRPVYLIRLDDDIARIAERYRLEPLEGLAGGTAVYRVVPPETGG